jgi:hypothetical protein
VCNHLQGFIRLASQHFTTKSAPKGQHLASNTCGARASRLCRTLGHLLLFGLRDQPTPRVPGPVS